MRVSEDLVSDLLSTQVDQGDAKQHTVAALSAELVERVMSSCDSRISTAQAGGTSEVYASSSGSTLSQAEICTADTGRAGWDCMPAPALALIGKDLPVRSLAAARIACKSWSRHFGEALTQAAPAAFLCGAPTDSGSSSVIAQLMREGAKCGPRETQKIMQKLDTLSSHTGLQAALQHQVQHSLDSWHHSLHQLFTSCPFLTALDLSHCAAVVANEDYAKLMVQPKQGSHPCAGAVVRHQPLPLNMDRLFTLLQHLPCLESLHLRLCKISEKSVQYMAWTLKTYWPNKPSSLTDIQISFAPAEELFLGHPTLPLTTEDVIELTIYSGIYKVNICNQTDISDMAIAALTLLPQLSTLLISGTSITNLGLYVMTTSASITKLDLSRSGGITDQGITSLSRLTCLACLDLSDCSNMGDPSLQALSRGLPRLQELSLHNCTHLTDAGAAALGSCSSLMSLNLAVCREVTDEGVGALGPLSRLSKLDLTFCDRLSDAVVPHLARLAGLQDLTLACCKLSGAGVAGLSQLQGLTSLDLVGCVDGVTSDAATAFSQMSSLKSLNLAFCSMLMDSGVQGLADLTGLVDLNLAYCKWVTDQGVAALSTLTALTSLNLQGCSQKAPHVGPCGLAALEHMTGLVSLNLGSCKLQPAGLYTLAGLTHLTELSMRFCKGPMAGDISAISTVQRLAKLDLKGCQGVTDDSMPAVQQLKNLRSLDISYSTHLTDDGLLQLVGLKELQCLSVNNCPAVSEACLDALLLALPGLRKISTSESYDAEQLHGLRLPSCYTTLPAAAIDNIPPALHHLEE